MRFRIRITLKRARIHLLHLNADPDNAPHQSDAICEHWSTDPPGLHCERPLPSMASFEPLKLLNFDFNTNLSPAF
jgi:hypothetical protein